MKIGQSTFLCQRPFGLALIRVNPARFGSKVAKAAAGTTKACGSRTRPDELRVELWVGESPYIAGRLLNRDFPLGIDREKFAGPEAEQFWIRPVP